MESSRDEERKSVKITVSTEEEQVRSAFGWRVDRG
jgi:hypothetical protein